MVICIPMSREEIKRRLDELAREYVETHNPEIAVELYRLARELEKMEEGVIELCAEVKPDDMPSPGVERNHNLRRPFTVR
jgi:hypothetical protein